MTVLCDCFQSILSMLKAHNNKIIIFLKLKYAASSTINLTYNDELWKLCMFRIWLILINHEGEIQTRSYIFHLIEWFTITITITLTYKSYNKTNCAFCLKKSKKLNLSRRSLTVDNTFCTINWFWWLLMQHLGNFVFFHRIVSDCWTDN